MKYTTFIALIVAGSSVIGAGAVMAKGPDGFGPRPSFEELDTDGDGEVTQDEMATMRARNFSAADTDGDGALSLEELRARALARAERRSERMLKTLDENGDGKLSAEEMPHRGGHAEHFSRLDADGSGGISKEEFDAARKQHHAGPGKWGKQWHQKQQN